MAVPLLYTLVLGALLIFVLPIIIGDATHVFGLGESSVAILVAALALPSFLITLVLPYALYQDIGLLNEYNITTAWRPDQSVYAILAAAGILVTGVSFGVSVYYLYQRHIHIGVP
ncbi:hypothetical protein ELS19_17660 [Halogeometricum borinquense]|uniref:Uncharacterized protein n=1 Tax=Halogeometricum borinquense TaxID=60847 RepID=A0A482T665_9EURY|nr:hypothetical protein [Halogeometricum borinquense]RYJ08377.1 hypothetical protein ELS19_17660 [Halogeometricum borinquense]